MDCARWFVAWSLLGYGYDVTLYSDWEVTFTFNIETAVVNVPTFSWQRFYTDNQMNIYRYFDQGLGHSRSLWNTPLYLYGITLYRITYTPSHFCQK